ncbi:MAG: hypothetical protein EOM76_09375 [Sphingobacteriia bacterium]|nr:hypothetical protein [Sphingobacteriia bacterium]
MKKKIILSIIVVLSVVACGTQKKTNVISYRTPYNGKVTVIGVGGEDFRGSEFLGSISVGESGFTKTKNCTYQAVINDAILLARGMGGNVICITEHKEPGWSTCHQIKCDVYYQNR